MSCEEEQQAVDDLDNLVSDLQASLEDAPTNQKSHIVAQINAAKAPAERRCLHDHAEAPRHGRRSRARTHEPHISHLPRGALFDHSGAADSHR